MAIHESLPGIEVTVQVDGVDLKEYPTKNDRVEHLDPNAALHQEAWTTTNYIVAETGKAFTLKLAVNDQYAMNSPSLVFRPQVDSHYIFGEVLEKSTRLPSPHIWCRNVVGPLKKAGPGYVINTMEFAEIRSSDEQIGKKAIAAQAQIMDAVGQIVVTVTRESACTSLKKYAGIGLRTPDYTQEWHQKNLVKEAKSHGMVLGIAKPAEQRGYMNVKPLDGYEYPLVIFRFKYRSTKALRDLRILRPLFPKAKQLSRNPSPESDRDIDKSELNVAMKREHQDEDHVDLKRGGKKSNSTELVTIDLTDDSE